MDKKLMQLYEFGPFRLDAGERLLSREGETVPLAPKTFDVLLAFVKQPGHLLDKEVLLKTVWPDSFVEENNLTDNIFRLRKALGEGENGQKFIETVPRRGYRFVADVKELNDEGAKSNRNGMDDTVSPIPSAVAEASLYEKNAPPTVLSARPKILMGVFGLLALTLAGVGIYMRVNSTPHIESLVVLPFSADPQTEYLSDGITESLINNLSRLSNLRVTARATAFSYKRKGASPRQVGQELNVGAVLMGRVALRDDSLTVQVDLVDTATGAQKWGERYQRKLSDIFAVQEEIGKQIAEKLRLRLSGAEQSQLAKRYTDNAEVYQLYLQGRYLFSKPTKQGLEKAIDYFQQAIAKDPNYALAYTDMANCYTLLGADAGPAKLTPQAKAAALRALEIDPNLAEAYAALSFIKWVCELDWTGAESAAQEALKLNPNSAEAHYTYARLLADAGRFEQAQAHAMISIQLDPLSIQTRKRVPYIHFLARRYDEAIAEYTKLVDIAPDFFPAIRELGLAYEQRGMYAEALRQFQKAAEMPENYAPTMLRADLGHLYAVWGKHTEAQQVLEELLRKSEQSYVSAYDIAVIYAGLGETDQAFRWLDKAIDQRPFWLCWLKLDPRLDWLRRDERFRGLLERIKL
jgi:TolB-like protein/DNA-binding winged helix-turn-helix (wHTH) protein/Tfp pilus assembly protein PilF